jgi:fatty acid desaturase
MNNFTKPLTQLVSKDDYAPNTYKLVEHLCTSILLVIFVRLTLQSILPFFFQLLAVSLILPIFMFRNFGLMHDCVHGSAIKNRVCNDIVGELTGTLCLLPFYQWKIIHLKHHYWAGNVDKDPAMRLIKDFPTRTEAQVGLLQLAWQKWLPIMALLQHFVFWAAAIQQTKSEKKMASRARCFFSYFTSITIYSGIVYALGVKSLLMLPGFLIYLVMVEAINFPHHLSLPQYRGEKVLPVFQQFIISRSCQYPKFFSRVVLNNFNYHTEHHLFPRLPWYKLDVIAPQIRQLLGDHYNGSIGSEWILKNRKLDLEDVLICEDSQMKSSA